MTDAEHELISDVAELQELGRRLAEVARRALTALRAAQDADGGHEPWIDDALREVTEALGSISSTTSS